MPSMSRGPGSLLRWLAFLPVVLTIGLAGVVITILLLDAFEDLWLALPVIALGMAVAVYAGARVAPARGRWPVAFASTLLLLTLAYLLSLTADGDREARTLALS